MTTSHALEDKYNAEDDVKKIQEHAQEKARRKIQNKFRKTTKSNRLAFVSYAF